MTRLLYLDLPERKKNVVIFHINPIDSRVNFCVANSGPHSINNERSLINVD